MGSLVKADHSLITANIEQGLLKKVNFRQLKIIEETGAAICADCHQQQDIHNHLSDRCIKVHGKEPLLHAFKLNGIALRFARSVVVKKRREDLLLLDEIADAIALGKIKRHFILIGHLPCGIAAKFGLSVYDCIELYYRGRLAIMRRFPHLEVSCLLHVDFTSLQPELGKKTYYLDLDVWPEYRQGFARYDHTTAPLWLPPRQRKLPRA